MPIPRRSILSWVPWVLLPVGLFAMWKWQGSAPPVNYITGTVTRGTLEDSVTATGDLRASQYVDIGAQVSGVLQKINVELGQEVKKGDLLAQIDPTVFEARVAEDEATLKNLEAQLVAAEATRKLAEQRLARNRNLLKSDAVSQDELDNSEASFTRSESAIDALKAQIEKASGSLKGTRASLGYTKIYAPMSGSVTQIQAREGQTLNASQTAPILFRLSDLGTMTVQAQVSEADVQRIRSGMPVYFTTLGAPDTRHEGVVRMMEPSPTSSNPPIFYNTLFDVPNTRRSLMPEMTAQVYFPMETRTNVLIMPLAAIDYAKNQRSALRSHVARGKKSPSTKVFVLRNERPVEVEVSLGMSNRVSAEVISGLSEQDEVITGPLDSAVKVPSSMPRGIMR